MITNHTDIQAIVDATKTPWINFHNFHAAFLAVQKVQDPQTHCHFKAVLVEIALTGKAYDLITQQYF